MSNVASLNTWNQWFRNGTIYETEFFHGLIACATQSPLDDILAHLTPEECVRLEKMARQLVSLEDQMEGQVVTSVARYDLADARAMLKQLEARSVSS